MTASFSFASDVFSETELFVSLEGVPVSCDDDVAPLLLLVEDIILHQEYQDHEEQAAYKFEGVAISSK